jgi:hypothetical protein
MKLWPILSHGYRRPMPRGQVDRPGRSKKAGVLPALIALTAGEMRKANLSPHACSISLSYWDAGIRPTYRSTAVWC